MKKLILGIATLGIIALVFLSWKPADKGLNSLASRSASTQQAGTLAKPQLAQLDRVASTNRWASEDRGTAALRAAYERDADLPAFFQTALTSPEHGGLYYARRVWSDCNAVRQTAALPNAGDAVKRVLSDTVRRCANVGDAATGQRLRGTLATSAVNRDPMMSLMSQFTGLLNGRKVDPVVVVKAADRAIEMGDAYMLTDALYSLVGVATEFDGKPMDNTTRDQVASAILLVRCAFGAPCNDPVAIGLNCPHGSTRCSNTLVDIALESEPGKPMSESERQAVVNVATKIAASARAGTLSSLFKV